MYACILETGRGFFEVVCAPGNATAYSRDPPPAPRFANPISGSLLSRRLRSYCTQLRCLLLLRGRLGTQPQRDVGGLYRLSHDP